MKITLYALFLSLVLFSCKTGNPEKTYKARSITANEDFNVFPESKKSILSIVKTDSGALAYADRYAIQYRDTTITIDDAPNPATKKFLDAIFINTQKTAVLVQVANEKGRKAPFYIIYLNNGNTEVVSLNKPSKGADDKKYTNGVEAIKLTSILINNDYFINTVNSKVYPVKRQNEAERIQGRFFMYSRDKKTLVFLVKGALYEVNVSTGETFTQPLPESLTSQPETLVSNVQRDYGWVPNEKGTLFLKKNADDNRIVDIKEFKH